MADLLPIRVSQDQKRNSRGGGMDIHKPRGAVALATVLALSCGLFSLVGGCDAAAPAKSSRDHASTDASKLAFVREYLRELESRDDLKTKLDREFAEAKTLSDQLPILIASSRRAQLIFQTNIRSLNSIPIPPRFSLAKDLLLQINSNDTLSHDRLISLATMAMGVPPSSNYRTQFANITSDVSKISAELEYNEESLFKLSPIVFAMLLADHPDSHGHMSRLSITSEERGSLVREITTWFGKDIEGGDNRYIVGSADIIRTKLLEYTPSDQPDK